jgi:uncharacterized membrane protein
MTAVTDVAFGSAWPRDPVPPRWMVIVFAVALMGWSLVALAVRFAGADTYAAIAREAGFADTTAFYLPADDPAASPQRVDLATLIGWHERWSAYVLGRSSDAPLTWAHPAFTDDEIRHMGDVRAVFFGAQLLMSLSAVGAIALVGLVLRRGPRTAGLLLRNGGLAAAAIVIAIGLTAALAFEPLFLAFHYVFFPQGNFLFPPTSNLIRLYPQAYWYAVTFRVGGAFIALAAATAVIGWLMSRPARVTRR